MTLLSVNRCFWVCFMFLQSPQVFEEDTRMSADLNNSNQSVTSMEPPLTPQK